MCWPSWGQLDSFRPKQAIAEQEHAFRKITKKQWDTAAITIYATPGGKPAVLSWYRRGCEKNKKNCKNCLGTLKWTLKTAVPRPEWKTAQSQ